VSNSLEPCSISPLKAFSVSAGVLQPVLHVPNQPVLLLSILPQPLLNDPLSLFPLFLAGWAFSASAGLGPNLDLPVLCCRVACALLREDAATYRWTISPCVSMSHGS
jgi:hypothetical protein